MQEPRIRDGGEAPHSFEVGCTLELQCADEAGDRAGLEPFVHQAQEALGIADDVAEQPIEAPDLARMRFA